MDQITSDYNAIRRVWDIIEIKNVMAYHEYYHAYGQHLTELEEIWVKKPENRATALCIHMYGWDEIVQQYGIDNVTSMQAELNALHKEYPDEIPNTPDNLYRGRTLIHAIVSPYIVVADDGMTAQGLWYTPGMVGGPTNPQTNVVHKNAFCMIGYEKYGCDFIKEDGEWKLWHMFVCGDRVFDDAESPIAAYTQGKTPEERTPYHNLFNYSQFPPIPNSYRTFSETRSYAHEMDVNKEADA